jgi:hypothetical protein
MATFSRMSAWDSVSEKQKRENKQFFSLIWHSLPKDMELQSESAIIQQIRIHALALPAKVSLTSHVHQLLNGKVDH